MVDIKLESKILTLVNINAPNEDKSTFFQNVLHQLTNLPTPIIIGGDFNLVLDVQKDKKDGRPVTHNNSLKDFICLFYVICLKNVLFALSCTTYNFYTTVAENGINYCNSFPWGENCQILFFKNNLRIGFSNCINKCKGSRRQD